MPSATSTWTHSHCFEIAMAILLRLARQSTQEYQGS
jgi:hypothetical protein